VLWVVLITRASVKISRSLNEKTLHSYLKIYSERIAFELQFRGIKRALHSHSRDRDSISSNFNITSFIMN
jgi:hypothetical protein